MHMLQKKAAVPLNGLDPSNPNNLPEVIQPRGLAENRKKLTASTNKVGPKYPGPMSANGYATAVANGALSEVNRQAKAYAYESDAPEGTSPAYGKNKYKCNVFVNKAFEYGGHNGPAHALTNDIRGDIQSAENLYRLAGSGGPVNDRLDAYPVDPKIAPFATGALVTQEWQDKDDPIGSAHHHVGIRTAPYEAASAADIARVNMFAEREQPMTLRSDIRTAYVLPKGMDPKPLMDAATKKYIESITPNMYNMYGLLPDMPEVSKAVYDTEWDKVLKNNDVLETGINDAVRHNPDLSIDDFRQLYDRFKYPHPYIRYKGQSLKDVWRNGIFYGQIR